MTHNLIDLVGLVEDMRTAQKKYRQSPSMSTLAEAQRREAAVERWIQEFRTGEKQAKLF